MGGDTKILKSGGQAGSRDGCIKKRRLETPYNYAELFLVRIFLYSVRILENTNEI